MGSSQGDYAMKVPRIQERGEAVEYVLSGSAMDPHKRKVGLAHEQGLGERAQVEARSAGGRTRGRRGWQRGW